MVLWRVGTFGISFSDDEDWGSQTYHDNARRQVGKSIIAGVLIAQTRAPPLPPPPPRHPPPSSSLSRGCAARPSSAKKSQGGSSSKKRKDRNGGVPPSDESKSTTVNFGFDSMSIHVSPPKFSGADNTSGGAANKVPPSSYKLFNRSANAMALWQEGSVVFMPAKDLLKQFSCVLYMDKVASAIERSAKKKSSGSAQGKDKVIMLNGFICIRFTTLCYFTE
jgi:hypothetical protein